MNYECVQMWAAFRHYFLQCNDAKRKQLFQKTAEDKVCGLNCVRKSRFLSDDMLFCFSRLFWWAFSTTSKVIYCHQTTLQLMSPILSNIQPNDLLERNVALQEIRNLLFFSFHGDMISLKHQHLIKEKKKHSNLFVKNVFITNSKQL